MENTEYSTLELEKIEENILEMFKSKGDELWKDIGLLVNQASSKKLYKANGHKDIKAWLHHLSSQCGCQPTTLWLYGRAIKKYCTMTGKQPNDICEVKASAIDIDTGFKVAKNNVASNEFSNEEADDFFKNVLNKKAGHYGKELKEYYQKTCDRDGLTRKERQAEELKGFTKSVLKNFKRLNSKTKNAAFESVLDLFRLEANKKVLDKIEMAVTQYFEEKQLQDEEILENAERSEEAPEMNIPEISDIPGNQETHSIPTQTH